jgi:hypothetical protein
MESEAIISFLVGSLAVLSTAVGTVTFFVLRPKIWIERSLEGPREIIQEDKTLPLQIKIKRARNILVGNASNLSISLTRESKTIASQEKGIREKVASSDITGALIVVQSEHEDLIDKVTRFDIYHSEGQKEEVNRFAEKAAEWFGAHLLREQEPLRLKEYTNG